MRAFITIAAGVGAAAVLAGCNAGNDSDASEITSRTVEVSDFRKIAVAGSYDVEVKTGSKPGVRVEGSERALDRLVVEVKGDVLEIHPRKGSSFSWGKSPKVRIAVTVPELEAATVAGSGKLAIDRVASPTFDSSIAGSAEVSIGQIKGQSFKGSIAGSAELEVGELAVQTVEMSIAGSGEADLAGKTEQASYRIAGSGNLDAAKLESRDVKLSIAGSGNLDARATGTVTGSVLGSGSAKISGGAKCDVRKAGSGSIDCS
jgi:hypothetical protein